MKKASLVLILITLLFGAFTGGLLFGRSVSSTPIQHLGSPSDATLAATEPSTKTTQPTTASVIDLNTATLDDLVTLPGIGPVLAQRILDYRNTNGPYKDIAQLANVSGIGEKRLAAIVPLVTV